MRTVSIALIHNNQEDRLSYVRPSINNLIALTQDHMQVNYSEISWQNRIEPHSKIMAFIRDGLYKQLARDWEAYRHVKSYSFMRDWISFLRRSFKKYFFYKSEREKWLKNSAIEMVVTSKHARAWELFVESESDYLLVLEDDVYFKSDTLKRYSEHIIPLLKSFNESLLYIDLAGGFSYTSLGIEKLEIKRTQDCIYYTIPVTNTACAYLISKDLVKIFVANLVKKPPLRIIGIDWLINKLFMLMSDNSNNCTCIHFNPTIFDHGSFSGQYISWQKD